MSHDVFFLMEWILISSAKSVSMEMRLFWFAFVAYTEMHKSRGQRITSHLCTTVDQDLVRHLVA